MPTTPPVSGKVTVGTLSGLLLALVTWILTTFVPPWHSGIPTILAQLLPGLLGAVGYFAGGWLAKHRITSAELAAAVKDLEEMYTAVHPVTQLTGSLGTFTAEPLSGLTGSTWSHTSSNVGAHARLADPIPPELADPSSDLGSGPYTPPDSGQ